MGFRLILVGKSTFLFQEWRLGVTYNVSDATHLASDSLKTQYFLVSKFDKPFLNFNQRRTTGITILVHALVGRKVGATLELNHSNNNFCIYVGVSYVVDSYNY